MAEYRYFTADVLTGEVLGELPLYGVYCDKKLKTAGNFNGTFRLDTGVENDMAMLDASTPMRTSIYFQRDNTTIWGGIIWSRTFESNAKTVQLSAQSFESYFSKIAIKENLTFTNVDQMLILKGLIDSIQSNPRSNLNIDTSQIVLSGINKSLEVFYYDWKYLSDAVAELADSDDGFDYTIQVADSGTVDHPALILSAQSPVIAPNNTQSVNVYDFPGTINQFYWPESGAKSGTDFITLGNGTGSEALSAVGTWSGSDIFPEIDQVISYKDVHSQESLNGIAQAVAQAYGPAVINPTITLKSDAKPAFDGWNGLGAYYKFALESPRFAFEGGTRLVTRRMIGWEFNPASSDQVETLKLVLEGEDASV